MSNKRPKRIDIAEEQERKLVKAKVAAEQGKLTAPEGTSVAEIIQVGLDLTAQFKEWFMQPYDAQARSLEVDNRNELQKIVDDIVDEHRDIDQNGLWYEIRRLKDKYSDVIVSVDDRDEEYIDKNGKVNVDRLIVWNSDRGVKKTPFYNLKDYLSRSKKRHR